ncbi:hypothetical protein KCP75_22960 [Salmonella enterica subsp. enterica]|nr:hypothetical protein KCP75_22960 [Salmonella enterica subsp. enterica]
MYPLIPVLSREATFVARGAHCCLSYVPGMAATYTLDASRRRGGITVSGDCSTARSQLLIDAAIVFTLLALSMFGPVHYSSPMQTRLTCNE